MHASVRKEDRKEETKEENTEDTKEERSTWEERGTTKEAKEKRPGEKDKASKCHATHAGSSDTAQRTAGLQGKATEAKEEHTQWNGKRKQKMRRRQKEQDA